TECKNWLNDAIKKEYILFHNYDSFQNVERIDNGAFGTVFCAFSKKYQKMVALKTVTGNSTKQLVNEIKQHKKVDPHDNILRLLGITTKGMDRFHYIRMDWNNKLKFARQIASAVKCLHDNGIIHRDLHSRNVLIHNENIKLCDFGISKSLSEPSNSGLKLYGTLQYSDPQYLKNPNGYTRNKKSDIYSIGILFWEISSGKVPFESETSAGFSFVFSIVNGKREKIIEGSPRKYVEIYTKVVNNLDDVDITDTVNNIIPLPKPFDINNHNREQHENIDADEEDEQEFGDDKEYYYRKNEDDDIQLMTKEQNEIISNLNSFLNEMTRLFLARIETSKPKKIAKELKNYMILNNINHTELFNVIYTDYINDLNIKIMLGFLCQYGIGVKRDEEKAFDIYTNLLLLNCKESKIIYYLLGMCYQYGTDIKKEYCEAFECYLKSAEEKNSNGQYRLGFCYQYGIGTKKNYNKAFQWYLKCAENQNSVGEYNIGCCYQFGIGIQQDYEEAFEWYLKSANHEDSDGQCNVGYCYHFGIGIEKDENKAFEWYLKSAEDENSNGHNQLGHCYQYGIGKEKNYNQAFQWYLKSAENQNSVGQYNVGYCYHHGIGIQQDLDRAFQWYSKSAENGNRNGQNQLGYCYQDGIGTEEDTYMATKWFKNASNNKRDNWNISIEENTTIGSHKIPLQPPTIKRPNIKNFNMGDFFNEILELFMTKIEINNHHHVTKILMNYITQNDANSIELFDYMQDCDDDVNVNNIKLILGFFYQCGIGTKIDAKIAFNIYLNLSNYGVKDKIVGYLLGYCYHHGIGIQQDLNQAFQWYLISAENGNSNAQRNVGCCYHYEIDEIRDYNKAFEWYLKSAENGNGGAQFIVGFCYHYVIGVEKNYGKAFEWYLKSAEKGNSNGQYSVGYCYHYGIGTKKNYNKAFQWYLMSAENMNSNGQNSVGYCYENNKKILI
ncbi:12270_t:CDS:2, partial [Entrophospora sp. SA101]